MQGEAIVGIDGKDGDPGVNGTKVKHLINKCSDLFVLGW